MMRRPDRPAGRVEISTAETNFRVVEMRLDGESVKATGARTR